MLAIVSLVSGLLGWTLLPVVGSLVAILTGHFARSEIRRAPESFEGDGFAVAGLVLGYAMVALATLGMLALVLFFGGLAALVAMAAVLG
ncbi:membrane protein [Lysobacter arseniciresistens ZS79]|uniref:Membrane protein n=1 Tax=Lysobacter arseniciresistens ZS79 TaxID=913325 RepID=A0A0A0F548_9GAMM|nr:membrane protein [Lysobacter arseniciresistens ZS79]